MSFLNKVVIVGTSGCGKTTLGRKLSVLNGQKLVDLDEIYWLPNWTPRPDEEFFTLLQQEIASDGWVLCGNYSRAQQQIWDQADTIIWIDLPLSTCLWRGFKRSIFRLITQEPCCNGNYETASRFFSKNSILLWIYNTYARRKNAYSKLFSTPSHSRQFIRLKNTIELNEFINNF
jgi:adenylate kinase family enzyme